MIRSRHAARRFLNPACLSLALVTAVATLVLVPTDGLAAAHLTARLDGAQPVPPTGSPATGTGAFELSEDGTQLAFRITVEGLSGNITAVHFHDAPAGVNGGVVRDIFAEFTGNTAAGVWTSADTGPLTPALVASLLSGGIYVNIHTTAFPGGEVRGQLETVAGVQLAGKADGSQPVPPTGAPGTGTGSMTLGPSGLRYDITVEGLSGPITVAHFHNAPTGANGGVVFDLTPSFTGTTATGTWTFGGGLSPALVREILDGNIYYNIHTAAHPGGEIRGQLELRAASGHTARLDGSQEIPPVATAARGTAVLSLSEDLGTLQYDITVAGLSGPITAAHFHNAPAGANGGVVRNITPSFVGNTASGSWTSGDTPPLTPALVAELLAGRLYLNVHTAANPGGEIRGQVGIATGIGFTAGLDGDQEVPPVATLARGTGSLALTSAGLGFDVTVQGLAGTFTASHIHNAPAGANGGVVRDLSGAFTGNTATGVWSPGDPQALTPALIGELVAQRLYVNVHTTAHPGGEIRGQIGSQTVVGIASSPAPTRGLLLAQNTPNPFNPTTTISYDVPGETQVRLRVFDTLGRQVAQLVDAVQSGRQRVAFDATGLASGVYFYRLEAGPETRTRKLVLSK